MNKVLKLAISEISENVKTLQAKGQKISNLTIGDFAIKAFKAPQVLVNAIKQGLNQGLTNYPSVGGEIELKKLLQTYLLRYWHLKATNEQIIVASGARSLIYLAMKVLLRPSEKVIVSFPSWNLINFTTLNGAERIEIRTTVKNRFLIQASDLSEAILAQGKILYLNIPHNPSGATYTSEEFKAIAQVLVRENDRRKKAKLEPLWVIIDGIYGVLSGTLAIDFLAGQEALLPFLILIDGASKVFCATGLRLGWAWGPENVIQKMTSFNSTIGAWAAKPIQYGMIQFLKKTDLVDQSIEKLRRSLKKRRETVIKYLSPLKKKQYLDYINMEATIYLSLDLSQLVPYLTEDLDRWLLEKVGIAMVNFRYFGLNNTHWYRVSLVNTSMRELTDGFRRLKRNVIELMRDKKGKKSNV